MSADRAAVALFVRPDSLSLPDGRQIDGQGQLGLYREYLEQGGAESAWFAVPGLPAGLREERAAAVSQALSLGEQIPVLFAAGPDGDARITYEAILVGLQTTPEPTPAAGPELPAALQAVRGRVWLQIAGLHPVDRDLAGWVLDGLGVDLQDAVVAHYQFGFVCSQPAARLNVYDELTVVEHVERFLSAQGFSYAPELLRSFWIGLKTGGCQLLGGVSGTGRSSLPALFAAAIGAEFRRINVGEGEAVTRALGGGTAPDRLRLILLDGVNRTRSEEFLPDLLDDLTDRGRPDGTAGSDRLVATLSNDPSAYPPPRSVLDRANLLELTVSPDDLAADQPAGEAVEPIALSAANFCSFLATAGDARHRPEFAAIARILGEAGIHLGYRIRREMEMFTANGSGLFSGTDLLDLQIKQRILPLLWGGGSRVRQATLAMAEFCAAKGLHRSQARLTLMLERLEADGLVDHRW